MEGLIGHGAAGGSLEISNEQPLRVSLEKTVLVRKRLSLAYSRIDAVTFEASGLSIHCGKSAIRISGYALEPVYEALSKHTAARLIEQESEDWDEDGPEAPVITRIEWGAEFD